MAESSGSNQLFDLWKRQLEESTQAWTRLVGQTSAAPAPPPDPAAFWQPVLDQGVQTWAKLFAQTPASPELVTQWKQFLDQWIESWSRVLGPDGSIFPRSLPSRPSPATACARSRTVSRSTSGGAS